MGYRVEWQVLNSKDFGVPQNRERVFIVGHLGGTSGRQVFPITGTNSKNTLVTGEDISYALDANYHKGTNTLSKSRRQLVALKNINKAESQANRIYDIDGITPSLRALGGGLGAKTGLYQIDTQVRRLTPTECERLQGFPDGWTAGLSDTQRYKTLGNAVTVPVVTAVMNKLQRIN